MQSISTNNLFMHGHEKCGGASNIACPPLEKVRGQLSPLAPRSTSGGHATDALYNQMKQRIIT